MNRIKSFFSKKRQAGFAGAGTASAPGAATQAASRTLGSIKPTRSRMLEYDHALVWVVVSLLSLGLDGVEETATGARADAGEVEPERIVAALVAAGVGVRGFAVRRPSLEDLFVSLTGEGFDVGE